MAIAVVCDHCGRAIKLKDSCAGSTGQCPFCNQQITVPKSNNNDKPATAVSVATSARESNRIEPTQKQLDFAESLGISIPKDISRGDLSRLIDERLENAPATESQKDFLRELGVSFPESIMTKQAGLLLDAAMDLRGQLQKTVSQEQEDYLMSLKEEVALTQHATEDQLLEELRNRGTRFAILMVDDAADDADEGAVKGRLFWTDDLSKEDVVYLVVPEEFLGCYE